MLSGTFVYLQTILFYFPISCSELHVLQKSKKNYTKYYWFLYYRLLVIFAIPQIVYHIQRLVKILYRYHFDGGRC